MGKLRQLLITLLIAAAWAICASAQSNLTQIRDTINNPDGTPFNGTVVITWVGFSTPSSGSVSPLSTSARIYNGALSVLLVPSTTAGAGSYYQVVYYSNDGLVTWTETWAVPPSTNALSVSGVRTSTTSGGGTSTGTGGGGGGTGGGGTTQYATLPITISEITGLSDDLTSINTSLTALQTTVNGLSTGSSGGSSAALTALTNTVNALSTTVTGLGTTVTGLSTSSSTNASNVAALTTTVNGINSTVTTLGTSVTSLTTAVSSLQSSGGSTISASFVDAETPSGTIDGSNAVFALSQVPAPAASLELYRNGLVQTATVDYSISGTQLTFLTGNVPVPGDILQAYYRAAGSSASTIFSDDEVPTGTANGTNVTFVLAHAPNPAIGLKLYKNGMLLQQHADYTISGATVTFASASAPQTGDAIVAYYRH